MSHPSGQAGGVPAASSASSASSAAHQSAAGLYAPPGATVPGLVSPHHLVSPHMPIYLDLWKQQRFAAHIMPAAAAAAAQAHTDDLMERERVMMMRYDYSRRSITCSDFTNCVVPLGTRRQSQEAKEKERMDRERQERQERDKHEKEKLEKERQNQALQNHFEKSLRVAEQKVIKAFLYTLSLICGATLEYYTLFNTVNMFDNNNAAM